MKLNAAESPWLYFALWQWLSHLQTTIPKREQMFRCRRSEHVDSGGYLIFCTYKTVKESREQIWSKHPMTPRKLPETGTFQYLLNCYHTLNEQYFWMGLSASSAFPCHHQEILALEIKSEDLNMQMIVASLLQTTSQNSHFSRLLLFYLTLFWADP